MVQNPEGKTNRGIKTDDDVLRFLIQEAGFVVDEEISEEDLSKEDKARLDAILADDGEEVSES